ncbi:MAG TPA: PQQ-binding-like beta-propeller repeat protein [Anaerolineae bacterium]
MPDVAAGNPNRIPATTFDRPWLTYLADPARTSDSAANIGAQTELRWTHPVSGLLASEPVIANGRVYMGAWDGNLYGLDVFDGHELWRRFLGTYKYKSGTGCPTGILGLTSSPALDPATGTLYIAGEDSTVAVMTTTENSLDPMPFLYAVDAASGDIRWRQQLSTDNNNYAWSSPLVVNGHAYVGMASAGDCPLTQGRLVSVELTGTHGIRWATMAPDAMALYNQVVGGNVPPLLPDGSDYDFTATLTLDYVTPNSADMRLQLRHAISGTSYQPHLMTGTCDNPAGLTLVQTLDDAHTAPADGTLTFSRTVVLDTSVLTDGQHVLVVPGLVPCSLIEAGTGGGVWSSPTYDEATRTVFVTTGTPTPPCVPQVGCTYTRSLVGRRNPAVVALDADTLAVKGVWQVPFRDQLVDADFGATASLCRSKAGLSVLGVANKNGVFYALNAERPDLWQTAGPLWFRTLSVGGPNPEQADGSISSAACADGFFYAAAGRPPDNALICAGFSGQLWALDADTGLPRWPEPHCTGLAIGPVTEAGNLVIVGANCRAAAGICPRRVELLDAATGQSVRQITGIGDILSGIAVSDNLLVFGENGECLSHGCTFNIRAYNAWHGQYMPLIRKET